MLKVLLLCACFIAIGCSIGRKDFKDLATNNKFSKDTQLEPEWKSEYYSENPDSVDLKVTYQEKYGMEKVYICKAVFSNSKTNQYKLISPKVNLVLERANLVSLKVEKIAISSNR